MTAPGRSTTGPATREMPVMRRRFAEVGVPAGDRARPAQRWIALGQLPEVAAPAEAATVLDGLLLPVTVPRRLIGRHRYRRHVTAVRGRPPG